MSVCDVAVDTPWGLSQGPGWYRAHPAELLDMIRDVVMCVRSMRLLFHRELAVYRNWENSLE